MKRRLKHILSDHSKKNGMLLAAGTIAAALAFGMPASYLVSGQQAVASVQKTVAEDISGTTTDHQASVTGVSSGKKASGLPEIVCRNSKNTKLTADAKKVRNVVKAFAGAYFGKDASGIRGLLTDSSSGNVFVYQGAADKVPQVVITGYDQINGVYCYTSLTYYKNAKKTGKQNLEIALIKTGKKWRITSYGLLSKDAQNIKKMLTGFISAYFGGSADRIQPYLADTYAEDVKTFEGAKDQVTVVAIKGLQQTGKKKAGDTCEVSVEYQEGGGSYQYLTVTVVKQADGWKVAFYGVEM